MLYPIKTEFFIKNIKNMFVCMYCHIIQETNLLIWTKYLSIMDAMVTNVEAVNL